jgi:spermidine/putrescine transport system permease protein
MLIIINVVPALLAKRQQKSEIKGHHILLPASALALILVAVAIFGRMGGTETTLPYAGQTLYVYMPGEYIGENIISDFEEQTGASVVMENFDSNEQMYIKVANGESYDILIPSDYMIQRLVEEDFLQELNHSRLTCMDSLNDAVKDMPFDPGNKYSISYFWGMVGIVYDKTVVDYADLEREGFDVFLDTKYKGDIYLYDSERDSFMMALKALGYSMNTEKEEELNDAYRWLEQCVTTMEPEIVMDEIIDNMAQARKALGICYSGDAAYIMSENENMGFYLPESGTNQWCDAMVIPKNAKNPELAHEFMNFISSYDFAYDNSSYVGYTSPNEEVMKDLASSDYDGINAYLPRIGYEKDEVFVYNEQTRKIISNLWSKIKIVASNAQ